MSETILDLTGERCPITTVRALNALLDLQPGDRLRLILDRGIPQANVPRSLAAAGHRIVFAEALDDERVAFVVEKG